MNKLHFLVNNLKKNLCFFNFDISFYKNLFKDDFDTVSNQNPKKYRDA